MIGPVEQLAIRVHKMMGGDISWPALPWIAEMLGCDDLDTLCFLLLTIRERANPNTTVDMEGT